MVDAVKQEKKATRGNVGKENLDENVLVLDSLLNKKFKRIELTLTSSVSRALSYMKLFFMRYASVPWTRC